MVIQRVREAAVEVDGQVVGRIGAGMLLLVGVSKTDGAADVEYAARKIAALRIFPDEAGRMNRAIGEVNGDVLLVSQFTLCADVRRGNRPGFDRAMSPEPAEALLRDLAAALAGRLPRPPQTGVFGADMKVRLLNDGPVTIVLDTPASAPEEPGAD